MKSWEDLFSYCRKSSTNHRDIWDSYINCCDYGIRKYKLPHVGIFAVREAGMYEYFFTASELFDLA